MVRFAPYWENPETLPEDGSIRAGTGMILESKCIKQEVIPFVYDVMLVKKIRSLGGEIEN